MLGLPILLWDKRLTTFAAEEARTVFTAVAVGSCG
jgi:hypothetical protein